MAKEEKKPQPLAGQKHGQLQKTDILRNPSADKKPKLLNTVEAPPADPVEHFRHMKCDKGHSNWDPLKVVYSIDHRAFIITCMDCDEDFIIPAGGQVPMPDAGLMEAAASK